MGGKNIAVIGSGIVGLSVGLSLQQSGHSVTLIDSNEPGASASFGNAGLFADYARLPFASFSTMRQIPKMWLDKTSPLSIQCRYLPQLLPYARHFTQACFTARREKNKRALAALQGISTTADKRLLQLTQADNLVKAEGCLALFSTKYALENAKQGDMLERQQQGTNLSFVSADEVRALEPRLAEFYAGGVFYPDTRFTINPLALSRRYADFFTRHGGVIVQDEVQSIEPPTETDRVTLNCSQGKSDFDNLVICAGVSSATLLKPLGYRVPLVSERGYHLMLDAGESAISRPVGWLDKSVFLTPMSAGIRLAGVAEFARADALPNKSLTDNLFNYAKQMLKKTPDIQSQWVGSRPSIPDSLPVIGALKHYPQIYVGFGHGHLGLTFAALTGQLIKEIINQEPPALDLAPFVPERFQ